MKSLLAVAALVVALLASAAPSPAASPSPARMQTQITALQRQTKALQRQVKTLQTQVGQQRTLIVGALAVTFCGVAATADGFQATWTTMNQFAQSQGRPAPFPSVTAGDDRGICQAIRVTRQRGTPNLNAFNALLALLED